MKSLKSIQTPYLLIAAGGSGGHLFPAQALARRLQARGVTVHFAGAELSKNPFFNADEFSGSDIESPRLRADALWRFAVGTCRGTYHAWHELRIQRPLAIVGFGSYHTVSVLVAGVLARIPLLLHEANAHPGRVTRLFTPFARSVAVHFAGLARGKHCHTQMPQNERWAHFAVPTRQELLSHFGLDATAHTLLICGGSQGAHFFNFRIPQIFAACAPLRRNVQVLHFAGMNAECKALEEHYRQAGLLATVRPFEERMHWAWSIADFAICRAGGSTLAELRHFQVPALLIPYPGARGHQTSNARHYIQETGGALFLAQNACTVDTLTSCLMEIFSPLGQTRSLLKAALGQVARKTQPLEIEEWVLRTLKLG